MWFSASAGAMILFAQALSGSTPAAAPPSTKTQAKAPAAVVCKSIGEPGSHFVQRTCHTPAEWAQITADAQSSVQQYQQGSSLGAPH